MQIAEFLEVARDEILAESVSYAKTILSLKYEDEEILRDHLPKVLEAISADLRTTQSRTESVAKGRGHAVPFNSAEPTGAETHGVLRARSGLHIEQVVAEYRALRACVLRLWTDAHPSEPDSLRDVGRFNEAIDQALAESVKTFAAEVERWQQVFLGVLGHDLRSPLNAIMLTTEVISRKAPDELKRSIGSLQRSAQRMATLMDSLLEYNQANLGSGMSIQRVSVDLKDACLEELEIQRAALPGANIDFTSDGNTQGEFDSSRIREALGNLVTNAVKHGLGTEPVVVKLLGNGQTVQLTVENAAAQQIGMNEMEQLFEPLRRGAVEKPGSERSHLGLGLFIVRQIAKVHGGQAYGSSTSNRVSFTMNLPKSIGG